MLVNLLAQKIVFFSKKFNILSYVKFLSLTVMFKSEPWKKESWFMFSSFSEWNYFSYAG
jgi:hypothetical protein